MKIKTSNLVDINNNKLEEVYLGIDNVTEELFHDFNYIEIEKTNGDVINKIYKSGELIAVQVDDEIHMLTSIPEFSSIYADLDEGKIWIDNRNDFSKARGNKALGYVYSTFYNNKGEKTPVSIHSLIMSSKLQQPIQSWQEEGLEVNHKDFNKENNSAYNLELITAAENVQHFHENNERKEARYLTKDEVRRVRYVATRLKIEGKFKQNQVAHYFSSKFDGVDYVNIYHVLVGNTFKDVKLTDEQKEDIHNRVKELEKEQIEKDIKLLSDLFE